MTRALWSETAQGMEKNRALGSNPSLATQKLWGLRQQLQVSKPQFLHLSVWGKISHWIYLNCIV